MTTKLPDHLAKFAAEYKLDPNNDFWEVRPKLWAVKHKAVERIALNLGVVWEPPQILEINTDKKVCALAVTGHLKDKVEWSTGEAAPGNNKNNYPVAMAEKRARDRVVLKLLLIHGDLYSDADDFDEPQAKFSNAAAFGLYTDHPQTDSPEPDPEEGLEGLTRHASQPVYNKLLDEMNVRAEERNPASLKKWWGDCRPRIASMHMHFRVTLRTAWMEAIQTAAANEQIDREADKTGSPLRQQLKGSLAL